MKKTKILILLILLVLLCGCNIKEKVVVDPYGKVSQEVTVPIVSSGIKESSIKDYTETILDQYKTVLNVRKYTYDVEYGKTTSNIIFKNSFDSICEYVKNTVFSQYIYKHIECIEDDEYITIENVTDHIDYCGACADWPSLDDVTYSITLPVKSVEDDADMVNNKTYTWKFDKNTTADKEIYLKISKKDLATNLKAYEKGEQRKDVLKKVLLIVIVIGILAGGFVVAKVLYKKYEENREY